MFHEQILDTTGHADGESYHETDFDPFPHLLDFFGVGFVSGVFDGFFLCGDTSLELGDGRSFHCLFGTIGGGCLVVTDTGLFDLVKSCPLGDAGC